MLRVAGWGTSIGYSSLLCTAVSDSDSHQQISGKVMHFLLQWQLGKSLLDPHFSPICLLENALFPLLLQGETGRSCFTWDLHKKQKGFRCPLPIWDRRVQHTPWFVLTPKIIQPQTSWEVTGKSKHNPGHTQWRKDCSLLSVCMYTLSDGFFWSSTLTVRENMDSTLRTWSRGRETSSLRLLFITQCHISSPLSHFLSPLFHLSAHAASLLGKSSPIPLMILQSSEPNWIVTWEYNFSLKSLLTLRRQKWISADLNRDRQSFLCGWDTERTKGSLNLKVTGLFIFLVATLENYCTFSPGRKPWYLLLCFLFPCEPPIDSRI